MRTLSYSSLRSNLSSALQDVNEDHEPIIITRKNGPSSVLMSLEDFNSYQETDYLLSNPKNAERLMRSIKEVEAGQTTKRDLIKV